MDDSRDADMSDEARIETPLAPAADGDLLLTYTPSPDRPSKGPWEPNWPSDQAPEAYADLEVRSVTGAEYRDFQKIYARRSYKRWNELQIAASEGLSEICLHLIDEHCAVIEDYGGFYYDHPLLLACHRGHFDTAKLLIKKGARYPLKTGMCYQMGPLESPRSPSPMMSFDFITPEPKEDRSSTPNELLLMPEILSSDEYPSQRNYKKDPLAFSPDELGSSLDEQLPVFTLCSEFLSRTAADGQEQQDLLPTYTPSLSPDAEYRSFKDEDEEVTLLNIKMLLASPADESEDAGVGGKEEDK